MGCASSKLESANDIAGRSNSRKDDGTAEYCIPSATPGKVEKPALEHHSASLPAATSPIEVPVQALCQDKRCHSNQPQQQQQQQQQRSACEHKQGAENGQTENHLQGGAQNAAECSEVNPMAKYDEKNPHHERFRAYENATTAMCDVDSDGHVLLSSDGNRTNFKGVKDFEDKERLQAIKSMLECFGCEPNTTSPEYHRFDPITDLLTSIFSMPIALVVFLDGSLGYLTGTTGMSQELPNSRGLSFCTWTLITLKPEVQVVPDTLRDGRFRTHPYVTGLPHVRFYAGAPLISSDGHRLGSLCLADYKPRAFDAECCSILCNFAEIVVRDAERFAHEQMQSVKQWAAGPAAEPVPSTKSWTEVEPLRNLLPSEATSVALLDTSLPGWPMLFASEGFTSTTGIHVDADSKAPFWDNFWPGSNQRGDSATSGRSEGTKFQQQVLLGSTFHVEVVSLSRESEATFIVCFTPASMEMLDNKAIHININIPGKYAQAVGINPSAYYFARVTRINNDSRRGSWVTTSDAQHIVPFSDVQLGGLLGKGSFGSVYIGLCGKEAVAVKVIDHRVLQGEPGSSDESARKKLEATLGLALDHPNIVRTIKFATVERARNQPLSRVRSLHLDRTGSGLVIANGTSGSASRLETWIVLSLCDQGSLQAAIDEGAYRSSQTCFTGAPDMAAILVTASEVASAMNYLHDKLIVHGDLTANNILLTSVGGVAPIDVESQSAKWDDPLQRTPVTAKVSDFGLSRVTSFKAVMSTNTFGTVTHMPPEMLSFGHLSMTVDVYAFGVILWEMYVGERPWAGLRPVAIIMRKTQGKASLMWPVGTPPAYRELANECMSDDPQSRPSFSAVVRRLASLTSDESDHRLEPHGDFAVYHGWRTEATILPDNGKVMAH